MIEYHLENSDVKNKKPHTFGMRLQLFNTR